MTDPELEQHCDHLEDLLQQAEYLLKSTIPLIGGGSRVERVTKTTIRHWLVEWRGVRLVRGSCERIPDIQIEVEE